MIGEDPQTTERLKMVYPDIAVRVRRVFQAMREQQGRAMRVTEGIRTFQYQANLYAQGRTAPGPKVTNSKPGDSIHHYGLAVDCCFNDTDPYLTKNRLGDKLWQAYGTYAGQYGLIWGGLWASVIDKPHVQLTYGLSLEEIKVIYARGGILGVWAACDLNRGVDIGQDWRLIESKVRVLGDTIGKFESPPSPLNSA